MTPLPAFSGSAKVAITVCAQANSSALGENTWLHGVSESQMEAVSFGKERPADTGTDEAAYAKNRRAELINR